MEGVDPWGESRDARKYKGPHPVIAHPPCQRWGKYWSGGPSAGVRRLRGDDDGCFAHALWAVRSFGGVIEHPAYSSAWQWFGLPRPSSEGGWTAKDNWGGASTHIEQGNYGHEARKATWLYCVGPGVGTRLIWGSSGPRRRLRRGVSLVGGTETSQREGGSTYEAYINAVDDPDTRHLPKHARSFIAAKRAGRTTVDWMNKRERERTPVEMARLMVGLARGG